MKVLLLYAHPVDESYASALHNEARLTLVNAGHDVDDCDLYAEKFSPILTREERIGYHNVPDNTEPVRPYVERLLAAEALVIVTPVWNFGWPAILKGYFDRVWLPGVTFDMGEGDRGTFSRKLTNIRKLVVVTTYGGHRWRALLVGDPPRKMATRVLRATINPRDGVTYLAHYNMNNCTGETRARFLKKVQVEMQKL